MIKREFLQALTTIPFFNMTGAVFAEVDEAGETMQYHCNVDSDEFRQIRQWMIERASTQLPENTPFELRVAIPENFGRDKFISWYYSDFFDDQEWKVSSHDCHLQFNNENGCFNAGRYIT